MHSRLFAKVEKRDMNIKPQDKTIKELLLSGRQFVIPRFQREYSWDKKNYKEFLDDMLNCLFINKNGDIASDQYFLGTMLFVGDCFSDDKAEVDVVDGQQRLTTITILFSALSDKFLQLGQDVLSKQIFKYIMTYDDMEQLLRHVHLLSWRFLQILPVRCRFMSRKSRKVWIVLRNSTYKAICRIIYYST